MAALSGRLYLQLQAGRRADQLMSLPMFVLVSLSTCVNAAIATPAWLVTVGVDQEAVWAVARPGLA